MKKYTILLSLIMLISFGINAQNIIVTGGPGRVNNTTVIKGLPFTAQVSGLNGTPQRWAVGIGTVNGQVIFNTSSTTVQDAVVDRTISGNTALISVSATNGNGVARYLTVQDGIPSCNPNVAFLTSNDCSSLAAIVNPVPIGATSYSWTVTPNTPFTVNGNGRSITLRNLRSNTTYSFTAKIIGGVCNEQTASGSYTTGNCNGLPIIEEQSMGMKLSPNPTKSNNKVGIEIDGVNSNYDISLFSMEGLEVEDIQIQKDAQGINLDTSNLKPGVYYIRATGKDGKQTTQRLLVK